MRQVWQIQWKDGTPFRFGNSNYSDEHAARFALHQAVASHGAKLKLVSYVELTPALQSVINAAKKHLKRELQRTGERVVREKDFSEHQVSVEELRLLFATERLVKYEEQRAEKERRASMNPSRR